MKNNNLNEIKREIVIERLRQIPPKVSIAFGTSSGFMSGDDMIKQVENDTEIGKKIIEIQFTYLKAFKKESLMSN